jgi:hypothetical protein
MVSPGRFDPLNRPVVNHRTVPFRRFSGKTAGIPRISAPQRKLPITRA